MARLVGPVRMSQRIGARIRELRQREAMTQEQLALACNLSPGFIALLESGTRLPSLAALIAVAAALNREAFELLLFESTNPYRDLISAVRDKDWPSVDVALASLGRDFSNNNTQRAPQDADSPRADGAVFAPESAGRDRGEPTAAPSGRDKRK
jgi:transcriptional regulator with XRE-family HTH domain